MYIFERAIYTTLVLMTDDFFPAVLNDRNTGIHGEMMIPKTEGEDFRHSIKVGRPESTIIYLCRNNCTKEDILIEALGNRATTGKYIIRYDEKLFVTIKQLTLSDAGWYRFGVANSSSQGSYMDFEIRIKGLKSRGTSTGRSEQHDGTGQQHALYDNNYPAFVVEEAPYETVDPPASYQILNQSHAVYDHIYSAITTPT
ncbi:hypothetical protein EXN66_Car013044 [Channa argus]|uniref:Immunoglobulin subtype domain-containing protein n=1 Tax=Channa argus TaxID=215402 RepID=A0A6G1Q4N3_CHAAH|nr:hypothetical protein EXN66_Car013044 [Channa argus]